MQLSACITFAFLNELFPRLSPCTNENFFRTASDRMLEGAWERSSELGTFCQCVMLIDGHCTVVTVFIYLVMEGSKLQLDT